MAKITPLISVKSTYHEANIEILKAVRGLSDDQIRWQPYPACHSIAFVLWHVVRWTDHLQATIPGMTEELARRLPAGEQIWEKEGLAERWGFDPAALGESETGTGFEIKASGEPAWPEKAVLMDYAEQVFAAADQAIAVLDEEQFQATERLQYDDEYMKASVAKTGTVGNALMEHLVHSAQHLGEISYLAGMLKPALGDT